MIEVDAVITWVDGADPAHKAQRDFYLAEAKAEADAFARPPLHDNGTNPIAGCVNDLPELERSFPDARVWIEEAIGG